MQVRAVRALALAAVALASSASAMSLSASSASAATGTATGSVSCVFRYSMPTASNIPSEVAAAAASSTTAAASASTSGSADEGGSSATTGSVGDGSAATAGVVSAAGNSDSGSTSDSGDASASDSASGSSTPSATTKTPSATTKTPSTTTKTPSTTTATPSSTTKTPSTTTATPTSTTKTPTSTTATPSTSDGSSDASTRRLEAEAGAATSLTSTTSNATATATSTASNATSAVTSTTTAPSTSTTTTSSSSSSSASSSGSSASGATTSTTTTTTSSSSSSAWSSSSSSAAVSTTTVEFTCDATFYSAWASMGLTCDGSALDVDAAAAQTQCLIYSGTADGTGLTDLTTCVSVCRFPACSNGTWDYTADDGINSDIYADLDLLTLLTYAGESAAVEGAVTQPFSNMTMTTTSQCDYTSDSSFSACQCDNYVVSGTSASTTGSTTSSQSSEYTVPENKGLEDSDHWADGTTKSTVDKAGIASTAIGSSAATVSVVAGGVMSVASGIVGGTSAGVASGVSAAASVGITMAAVDLCQFSVMINQMNVDARPRFLENMGKKMSASAFTFLPFGKNSSSSTNSTSSSGSSSSSTHRRLGSSSTSASASASSSGSSSSSSTSSVQGMEKYADLIGVDADMLFYLTVAGIGCLIGALFLCYAIAMGIASFFVSDFPEFRKKWLDKAIGVLMMILILSEYAIGATAMYQICYCIDNSSIDASFVLAIIALLVMAFGTILFGIMVIRNNEEELRDIGTKHHFDKKFHARFGPLYDEYSFEGRFFFAPKLMLALLCGMTTGMVWIQGLWQIVVLIGFHIAFLFYLEMKQPYPTAFVQKTSSFVIIIKISALFLSFFLLSSATSFNEDIPDDLREGVGFAIIGLQVLVLVALMIRQVYIFYRTWKLKRDGGAAADNDDDKAGTTVVTSSNRDGANDPFFSLGEPNRQYPGQQQQPMQQQQQTSYRENSVVMLGDDSYGYQQQQQHHQQALRGLQPPAGRRTASVVVHDGPGGYRSNEVSL